MPLEIPYSPFSPDKRDKGSSPFRRLSASFDVDEINDESSGTFSGRISDKLLSPLRDPDASSSSPWKTLGSAFQELQKSKNDISLLVPSVPSSTSTAEGFNLPLIGELDLEKVKSAAKLWLKDPKNLAVCVWGLAVGISGAILFLVMVGLLDRQLHTKRQRDAWFEVNNQILNALFTMMCLYLHPQRCFHLVMLFRWQPQDITMLRKVYCKNGTYKPHEWTHMLVVLILLQVNCFAQYALCGLNWGFKRSQRPAIGVGLCLAAAIGAPAAAGIYSSLSPLAKEFHVTEEGDVHMQRSIQIHEVKISRTHSLRIGRAPQICCGEVSVVTADGGLVEDPRWNGSLLNCCMDPHVAILSTACPFCVFGWNMERLGFGNRYVHIVTFILFCTAPFWILTLAAINIDDTRIRKALGISGIILSIFGLLYGGFWRTQIRRTYKLPAQSWCFGKHVLTDYAQWLFCALCSLCQEVRTSEYYRVREYKFYEQRAFSEISSMPSPSSIYSPRRNQLLAEASSPISFRASPTASYSFSSQSESPKLHNLEVVIDKKSVFASEIKNTDSMVPPPLQLFVQEKTFF